MGLFSRFNKTNTETVNGNGLNGHAGPEIPEDVFIEKEKPQVNGQDNMINSGLNERGIYLLYQVMERNYNAKGYEDALINPDTSNLTENIESLKNELQRMIKRVKTFYEDFLKEVEFHIISRSRSGMTDMVEELTMKKETAEMHMIKIKDIEKETLESKGDCQGIILSYTRGFKNGLAAISHHSILKRQF
jgi:hypothetical protein